jgi:Tol biopolymer transport system component
MLKMRNKYFLCGITFSAVALIAGARVYAQRAGGPPGSVAFYSARDGHSNNQIYVMDPDGSNQVRITHDVASDVDPDISPNGRRIVFTSNQTETGNNNIFVRDRRGVVRNLTNDPATDEWARWSPDGKQIVFDSNRDGGVFEIYVMNADGAGTPTRLTDPPTLGRYPSWSPDGEQIVFRRGIDIYTINADGSGAPVQLTSEVAPSFAQMPVFSPDGRYIAFMSFREGYCSVFRMTADGDEQTNLTPKDPGDPASKWCSRAPSWSADGREIFFMSFRPSTGGQNEIFVMNMDGTDVRQLTDTGTNGSPRARGRHPTPGCRASRWVVDPDACDD